MSRTRVALFRTWISYAHEFLDIDPKWKMLKLETLNPMSRRSQVKSEDLGPETLIRILQAEDIKPEDPKD